MLRSSGATTANGDAPTTSVQDAASSPASVPTVTREPFSLEELKEALEHVSARMVEGNLRFRGEFCISDLKQHLLEELADTACYAILGMIRVTRAFPEFESYPYP